MQLFRLSPTTHTITVWRHWDEWKECYQNMFPTHTEQLDARREQQLALQTVHAWRARGRVPLAVECTAQLVELNLQHHYPTPPPPAAIPAPPCSTLASRHQYSLCLLRLVNGILDPQQSKQHAQSINALAKQVQMPRILVDIRHESTHQQLPSLPLLQLASLAALEWLQRHYWTAQSHALSKTDDALRAHLKAYKRALERSSASMTPAAAAAKAARDAAVTLSVNQGDTILLSEMGAHSSASGAIPDRAQDALKSLFSALCSGNTLQHTRSIVEGKFVPMLLSDAFMLKPPKQSRVSLSSVFRRLVETWDGAIHFLAQRCKSQNLNLAHLLLTAMVRRMATRGAQLRPTVAGLIPQADWELDLLREWSLHLLHTQAGALFRDDRDSASAPKKRSHAAMQDATNARISPLDSVMHTVLTNLNPWLAPLLPLLLPLFKQQHGDRAPAVARLEMLLYLTTKSLYPADRVMLPTSVTSAATAAVAADPQPPVDAIRSFIATHKDGAASNGAAVNDAAAVALAAARCERVSNFPFLPLGVAPGDADAQAALLQDDWFDPLAPQVAAPVAAPLPAVDAADHASAQPDSSGAGASPVASDPMEEEEPAVAQLAASTKRARAEAPVAPAKPSANELLQRQAALQRLQQSLHWM